MLLKRVFFTFSLNVSLFLILMIGIQNSDNKSKVNLIVNETISLPISFIMGTSFIFGSLLGSFVPIYFVDEKDN